MTERRNEWFAPGSVWAALGMLAAIAGAWMMFESRITAVEQVGAFNSRQIADQRSDLKAINDKLDRLIERD